MLHLMRREIISVFSDVFDKNISVFSDVFDKNILVIQIKALSLHTL